MGSIYAQSDRRSARRRPWRFRLYMLWFELDGLLLKKVRHPLARWLAGEPLSSDEAACQGDPLGIHIAVARERLRADELAERLQAADDLQAVIDLLYREVMEGLGGDGTPPTGPMT